MTLLQSRMSPRRRAAIRELVENEAAGHAAAVTPWRKNRRLVVTAAFAAAVIVAGSVVLADRSDAPVSYAGWTAVPQAAPPPEPSGDDDIEEWASKCTDLGVGGVGIEGVPARPEAAARREVLVDRRGDLTYCVDVSIGSGTPRDPLIALSGIKAGEDGLAIGSVTVYDKPFTPPRAGDILVLGGTVEAPPTDGSDRLEAYQVYGLSGPDVTGMDVVLTNGLRVTASVRGGVWGAWWPADRGEAAGYLLVVRTTAGSRTIDPVTVHLVFD